MNKLTLLAALVGGALIGCQAEPESASYAVEESLDYAETAMADLDASAATGASEPLAYEPTADALQRTSASQSEAETDAPTVRSASPAPTSRPTPAALQGRHLRRSADLRIAVDDVEATMREARATATRYGGLVTGEDGHASDHHAETLLTLRVPSDRFEAAVDALASLGTVEQRAVSVDDVTAQVVDLEARLRARRAAEARLVALVGETDGLDEMLLVQGRLEALRAEIESMESSARALRGSVALSTIRATFVTVGAVAPPPPGVFARAVDGIAAGWHGVLAVILGVLPLWPLAVLAAVGLAVWRRVQPRLSA